MKKQPIMIATVFIAGLLFFSQTASAGYFKERHQKQKYRIQRGIATGQITPREAKKLFRNQQKIRELRRHYLSDGELSRRERKILEKRVDQRSKHIYRYKHNSRQVKAPWYGNHGFFFYGWR